MADVKFISGLNFKAKNPNAPDYVICKGSIKREDLIAWLQTERDEWVNFDVKVSQNGKWYAAVDDWKPNGGSGGRNGSSSPKQPEKKSEYLDNLDPFGEFDDPIPF